MKKTVKRAITLLEIMIVVLLIGIIGSVLGVNMKGSLDEGKAFKSREGAKQIRDILLMQVESDEALRNIVEVEDNVAIEKALQNSGLVADPKKLLVDGWGKPYHYELLEGEEGEGDFSDLKVTSEKLLAYEAKKEKKKRT